MQTRPLTFLHLYIKEKNRVNLYWILSELVLNIWPKQHSSYFFNISNISPSWCGILGLSFLITYLVTGGFSLHKSFFLKNLYVEVKIILRRHISISFTKAGTGIYVFILFHFCCCNEFLRLLTCEFIVRLVYSCFFKHPFLPKSIFAFFLSTLGQKSP